MNVDVAALAARLPEPGVLARWLQILATADLILQPEFDYRVWKFDWDWADDQAMGSYDNGSGDEFSVTFTPDGAYLRAFDHESPLSPWARDDLEVMPGIWNGLPDALRSSAEEPAFTLDDVPSCTLALWWPAGADHWSHGDLDPDEDGGVWMFGVLDGTPESYLSWAQDYYDTPVDADAIRAIFSGALDEDVVRALNPDIGISDIAEDLKGIGYDLD